MVKQTIPCSRGRVHRLMKRLNIHSARKKAYKSTTNSNHSYPIAPNLLERQFRFEQPNKAWVGDITYIPTDEDWLYLAMARTCVQEELWATHFLTASTHNSFWMPLTRPFAGSGPSRYLFFIVTLVFSTPLTLTGSD